MFERLICNKFRPGANGACEASLWEFSSFTTEEEQTSGPLWVAACTLDEALSYVRSSYPDFRVSGIKLIRLIEMVSGSPRD
jgi:hypothetical protein